MWEYECQRPIVIVNKLRLIHNCILRVDNPNKLNAAVDEGNPMTKCTIINIKQNIKFNVLTMMPI